MPSFPNRGKALWFACNTTHYCAPNCPSFCQPPLGGTGWCGGSCSWDQCHCAWADALRSDNARCQNDTCQDVTEVGCGQWLQITNLCNSRVTNAKIVDCSVGGNCVGAGDCLNLSATIIELSPRVWAAGLCIDLCNGYMSVEVTNPSATTCPTSTPGCPSW